MCGCEVPGVILLRDINGTMRLNHSKDVSVHVSACTMYYFNVVTLFAWKLWH